MKREKFPVVVHLFLFNKKNLLLLKRRNTGYEDEHYGVVAGHLEENENVYNAIIREAKEEVGINILLDDLKIVQVMHFKDANEERIDYFFLCRKWEGDIKNMELKKCSELNWYPIDDLPDNTIECVKFAINNYIQKINFTLFGW